MKLLVSWNNEVNTMGKNNGFYFAKEQLKPELRSTVVDSPERTAALQYELHVYMDAELGLRSYYFGFSRGSYFVEQGNALLRVYDGLNEETAYKMNNRICGGRYSSVEQVDLELLVENAQGKALIPKGEVVPQKFGNPVQYYEVK
jgi:hypothetical protein